MYQLSTIRNSSIVLVLLFFITYFMACVGPKEKLQEVSASKTKTKKGKNVLLLFDDQVQDKAAYENIKGNIPRLKAMLSGQFVQYNTNADPKREVYSTWYVNEGKDSVMVYQLPVGEPNKVGHWMYHYQYMTSLPNEPVYVYFSKMTEINRDSIVAVYYEVPETFTATIPEILAKPQEIFKNFDFENLKLAETGEVVYYERKTPLKYEGISVLRKTNSKAEERQGGFDADYYSVTPEQYQFGIAYYTRDKEPIARTRGERLVKEARVMNEYFER